MAKKGKVFTPAGFLLGLLFSISLTILTLVSKQMPISMTSLVSFFRNDPAMLILWTIPFFSGLIFFIAYRSYGNVLDQNEELQKSVEDIAATLNGARSANQISDKRLSHLSNHLRLLAATADLASKLHNLNEFLHQTAALVARHSGFFHVGIFLFDEATNRAVLKASNSEPGKKLIAQNYEIPLRKSDLAYREEGTWNGEQMKSATASLNIELPESRSKIWLTIRNKGRAIGFLDVQSKQENAFDDETISMLQTIAHMIIGAVEYESQLRKNDEWQQAMEASQQRETKLNWSSHLSGSKIGFRYSKQDGITISRKPQDLQKPSNGNVLEVPFELRGQQIGKISLRREGNRGLWTKEEKEFAQEAASQITLALESARLYQEARVHAEREETLNRLTGQISRTLDMETLLKRTVEQFKELPNVLEVSVHTGTEEALNNVTNLADKK